jgi:hypothetical protein
MFARLRSWLKTALKLAPSEQVPTDAYAALIDDIYSAPMSFTIGAVTASVVGAIAFLRTGYFLLAVLTLATATVAIARVLLIRAYHRNIGTARTDAAALHRWERWYALGAYAYGGCIGGMCFVVFAFIDDPLSQLLLNTNAIGFAAGTSARNSSRPLIADHATFFHSTADRRRLRSPPHAALRCIVGDHIALLPGDGRNCSIPRRQPVTAVADHS